MASTVSHVRVKSRPHQTKIIGHIDISYCVAYSTIFSVHFIKIIMVEFKNSKKKNIFQYLKQELLCQWKWFYNWTSFKFAAQTSTIIEDKNKQKIVKKINVATYLYFCKWHAYSRPHHCVKWALEQHMFVYYV